MRIGELMVQLGVITPEQLATALRRREVIGGGGRLGATLVELGYLDEQVLARMLAEQLHTPEATEATLARAAPDAIALLSPEIAERHHVCPVRLDGRRLWVAMTDPTDAPLIDELTRLTGREVRAMVASETLVARAIGLHYGRGRSREYVNLADVAGMALEIEPLGAGPRGEPPPARSASPPPPDRMTLQALGERLLAAADHDALLQALVGFLEQDFGRVAALLLKNGHLVGSRSGGSVDAAALRRFAVRASGVPVLARILEDQAARIGRGTSSTLGPLGDVVGAPGDGAILLLPIKYSGQVAGCFVALDGRAGAEAWFPEYEAAGEKLDCALRILALKEYVRR